MGYITTVLASTAVIIILLYVIEYLINKFREYNMVKKCPGPKAYPLIGNLYMFLGDLKDITNKLINSSEIYSSPWVMWVGPKLIVVCDDPENIEILSKSSNRYEKSSLYDFLKDFLGNGLLSAPGGLLESDLNLQSNPDCKLDEYLSEILDIIFSRMSKFWLHPSIIFNNSSMGKRLQENLSHFNKVTNEIIKKKKESMNEDNFIREGKGPHARKDTSPILDAIFKSFYETEEYSETDIRDEINTMAFAGSDTAAKTLTFLFSMLATFPDIQEKVYEELYDMYGSSDSVDVPVTMEDTKKMNYLDRVIKETLRLFPPGPIFARTLCSDIKVNENVTIPKNCQVAFPVFSLHRKDKYWTDPLRFNPDRFLPGNYNPKCFLPFSLGKRGCIGQIFAMIEMKAITAAILRKFIVQIDKPVLVENVNLKIGITTQLGEPIFLRFNKR
ncbi:hypothetical protein M0804_008271 [Polistes exclamans]|nr:hypothetical protein M0804_008271 [Polistes exclamans]